MEIKFFKDIRDVQKYKAEAGKAKVQLQKMIDILSATEEDDTGLYKGNEYRTYNKAINGIHTKYNGTAKWGVLQTGNIVDLRAAFIIAQGIKIIEKKTIEIEEGGKEKEKNKNEKKVDASREIQWANDFLEYNDLDKEIVQEFAKEAEIEGRILLKLDMDDTPEIDKYKDWEYQMAAVRFVSWLDKKYEISTPEDDYLKYTKASWRAAGNRKAGSLSADRFVYKKFGGRINDPNSAQPKIMKCLTQIDGLDKALRDWREINRIFGGPILYMKCADKNEVTLANTAFEDKNFKIKKMLAGTGDLQFVRLDTSGMDSLENEILTLAKMISGTTGVSVQYLGLVELLKNRSTSDDMREMLSSATVKERSTWEGAYEELITKAMNLFNEKVYGQKSESKKLNPSLIGVKISTITKQHWQNIKDVWLPAVVAGKITEELFLEQLPDVDLDDEMKRRQEKEDSELERLKTETEDLKGELAEQGSMGFPQKGDKGAIHED